MSAMIAEACVYTLAGRLSLEEWPYRWAGSSWSQFASCCDWRLYEVCEGSGVPNVVAEGVGEDLE